MRHRELLWGFFFLFSTVFILSIAIWKFIIYLNEAVYIYYLQLLNIFH